jgi:hypothetical protein
MRGECRRHVRENALEADTLVREPVQMRSQARFRAVASEPVGTEGVEGDEEEVPSREDPGGE